MPDGPLSPEVIAEFLARCRAQWVAAGAGEKASPEICDRVAAIVARNLPSGYWEQEEHLPPGPA